jgi:hypothetical protein
MGKKKENKIYVNESDIQHGKNVDGWVTTAQYIKMYGKTNYDMLLKHGSTGDVIGNGRYMYSQTEEDVHLSYANSMWRANETIKSERKSLQVCRKKKGKNCKVYEDNMKNMLKRKKRVMEKQKFILSLKNKKL